ncbi:hypothetical protein DIPPA_23941 [Diplonema papillatum]|nr:hypothetical protein DIPPA_23941 [Diplonema papillatum]
MSSKQLAALAEDGKPLFVLKADPSKYDQWTQEYESLESKHMKPLHGPEFRVYNLRSLRQTLKSASRSPEPRFAAPPELAPQARTPRAQYRPPGGDGGPAGADGGAGAAGEAQQKLQQNQHPHQQQQQQHHDDEFRQRKRPHTSAILGRSPGTDRGLATPPPLRAGSQARSPRSAVSAGLAPAPEAPGRLTEHDLAAVFKLLGGTNDAQFDVDTRGIDLSWLLPPRAGSARAASPQGSVGRSSSGNHNNHASSPQWSADPPSSLRTLSAMPTDLLDESGELALHTAAITSPRSAYVLLSHGVSVADLQTRSRTRDLGGSDGGGGGGATSGGAALLRQLQSGARDSLRDHLLRAYAAVCAENPLAAVVALAGGVFNAGQGGLASGNAETAEYLAKRKEHAKRLLDACRSRMEKEAATMDGRRREELRAERERLERVAEVEKEKKLKREAAAAAQKETFDRQSARQRQLWDAKQRALDAVEARRAEQEARDAARREQLAAQRESARRERQQATAAKKAALDRNLRRADEERARQRGTAEEKMRTADERKAEWDAAVAAARGEQQQAAAAAAAKRAQRYERALAEVQQKAEQSLEKRAVVESRLSVLRREQVAERDARRRQAREKSESRARKKDRAWRLQQETADGYRGKQVAKDTHLASLREELEHERKAASEARAADEWRKQQLVVFKARKTEFEKAKLLDAVHRKRARGEACERLREEITKECAKEREMLRRAKEEIINRNLKKQNEEKLMLPVES